MRKAVMAVIVAFHPENLHRTVLRVIPQVDLVVVIRNDRSEYTVPGTRTIVPDRNLGIAAALNVAVRLATESGYDWLLQLDQDSEVSDTYVQSMMVSMKGLSSYRVVGASPKVLVDGVPHATPKTRIHRKPVITSGMLIATEVFNTVGPYDESLFIDSVDFDFCIRLYSHEYRLLYCEQAELKHELGTSTVRYVFGHQVSHREHSSERVYYMARNHVILIRKHLLIVPAFMLKKTITMIIRLATVILIERNAAAKCCSFISGLIDGARNDRKKGPLELS